MEETVYELTPRGVRRFMVFLVIAAVGGVALIGLTVAGDVLAGYGWATKDGAPLDLTHALDAAPRVTKAEEDLAIDVPEGRGALVVLVGKNLIGHDTTTASCSARDGAGRPITMLSQPSIATQVTTGEGHLVGNDEQIVVDAGVRPGPLRKVIFRCSMLDSGIRSISAVTTEDVRFPEEKPWLRPAKLAGWGSLGIGILGMFVAVLTGRRRVIAPSA